MEVASPDANSPPTNCPLGTLLDGNHKATKAVYPESLNASGRKRQRAQFTEPTSHETPDGQFTDRRFRIEYVDVQQLPATLAAQQPAPSRSRRIKAPLSTAQPPVHQATSTKLLEGPSNSMAATNAQPSTNDVGPIQIPPPVPASDSSSLARMGASVPQVGRPEWHPPWKLMRVISGHLGWVRSLAVEPGNKWFASGAGDRTIKIWDLATGSLRLTLTGHISTVRGLAVSPRHPYLFSCGEDKMVKCWDLETNKVIRHYHGHLSGVYTLSLHPTLDVLVTGGRDGVARVWDMRTRSNIHVLSGHTGTVSDVKCQEADPQVITSSLDATVRLWDLAAGKTMGVLTHHKKGVRALATHPQEFTFATGSTGSIKQWKCPEGAFMQNFEGHNAIINTLSVNAENVLFSGGDNGSMSFWDWKSGHRFQSLDTTAQPGSLDAEAGIMSSTFDQSGLRLITGEADKTIKIWKQDDKATPETHPVMWHPTLARRKY
ncbi:pre-mRNA splicing factor prp46 [Colletotrichum plurivorum]|uniref:Pre-mRNA-splicing factor PRP46 n=1 Tax=Colletotrichum plurivorum TaxID=2175906 RepID=A0A8H6J4U7_9PEZI|nr:pre-mRNA splicing factor prp46 [Colletotrichum plurivorum]